MAKRRFRTKLLYKLLILFIGLATVPLLVVRTRVLQLGQEAMKKESLNIQLEIAKRSADTVYSFVQDIKNMLFVIQKPKEFVTMDLVKQKNILESLMLSYPAMMKLVVLDSTGKIRLKISRFAKEEEEIVGEDRSEHPLFTTALSEGEYLSKTYRSPENYPLLLVSVPIEVYAGKPVGVIAAEVNLIALSKQIAQIKIGEQGISYVVDETGNVIAHPEQKIVLKGENVRLIPLVDKALQTTDQGGLEFVYQEKKFLGSYVPVKKLAWRVIVQQPLEEAYLAAIKMREQVNLFLIVGLVGTVLIGIFFSYRLVKPIKVLQKETERVAGGDFNIQIVARSSDEIGVLADKFDYMTKCLKERTDQLIDAKIELEKWNKELELRVEERTRQLREAQAKLIQAERLAAIGQMANVIGHEIRNPLSAIKSAVYLLRELVLPSPEPDVEESLKVIDREIVASSKIADNLLGFSRTREPVCVPTDINGLLDESLSIVPPPETVKTIKDYTLDLPLGHIDRDEIRQVFTNLIKNASEIMVEKMGSGELRLMTKMADNMIQIAVGDTGPGISPENMEKMFTPFFSTKSRGTGLGLAACQRIVERHKGKIWVESELGKGATFFVQLPPTPTT